MKKASGFFALSVLGALMFCGAVTAAESEDSAVKDTIKSIVSGVVATGKDALAGADEGVDTGRKEGESTDKAAIVSDREGFLKLLGVTAVKTEDLGGEQFRIPLAVRNDNDFPVRVSKLSEMRSVVLLDQDGFSYPLPEPLTQGKDVTALGNSLTRVRYTFKAVEGAPATLRLFDSDIKLPEAVKSETGK